MLTTDDLNKIQEIFDTKIEVIDSRLEEISIRLKFIERNAKEHHDETENRLQASINRTVDVLGEDVWELKNKMKRVEEHLGFATM